MAAGNTYESIATQTLGSAAASVTFTSIPSTYTDLVLVFAGTNSANSEGTLQVNGDTATNYSATVLDGNGSSASSARYATRSSIYTQVLGCGTDQYNMIIHLQNYSNTTTYKTILTRFNAASKGTSACVGLWRSTSAITSITLGNLSGGNFNTGAVISLYGIKAA